MYSEENQNQLEDFIKFIVKLFLPILLKFVLLVILISVGVSSLSAVFNWQQQKAIAQVITQATTWDFGDPIQQEFIEVSGFRYGLPLKKDLTKVQKLMLLGIRVPEFGGRAETDLAGDLDSFCPYQQRVSELWSGNHIEAKARQVLGDKFDSIFDKYRKEFTSNNKNTQLRNYSKRTTFAYGVSHPYTGKHWGTDLEYKTGEPVSTPLSGIVIQVTYDFFGGGKVIVIKHEKQGIRTLYAHLSEQFVKEGDKVLAGQIVGRAGNTSPFPMADHLHFQIMNGLDGDWNSNTIDPGSQPFLLNIQQNHFMALILQLTNIHLQTGFCDELALERLKNEPSTKNWVNKESIDRSELNNLALALCQSQRPIDCNVWVERSLKVMERAILQI